VPHRFVEDAARLASELGDTSGTSFVGNLVKRDLRHDENEVVERAEQVRKRFLEVVDDACRSRGVGATMDALSVNEQLSVCLFSKLQQNGVDGAELMFRWRRWPMPWRVPAQPRNE
jgi:hypothetical protein